MFKLFGREQVVYLAIIAAAAQVLASYGFDASGKVQGIATAIVVFVFAVGNAIVVHDGAIALATGVLNALFALFAAFNLDWTATHQTAIVGFVTLLLGFFTRQVVTNPVTAAVSPAGKLVDGNAV
jgi:hypothetical protein